MYGSMSHHEDVNDDDPHNDSLHVDLLDHEVVVLVLLLDAVGPPLDEAASISLTKLTTFECLYQLGLVWCLNFAMKSNWKVNFSLI